MTSRSAEEILIQLLADLKSESSVDTDFIRIIQNDFEYLGFNATNILNRVNISLSNNKINKKDVLKLIALGMNRGNKVSNIAKTSKKATRDWLLKISRELNIKDNVSNTNSESAGDIITLSRLRMSMPQLALSILKFPEFKRQVSATSISSHFESFKYMPEIARDMCIMSLLPHESGDDNCAYDEIYHDVLVSHIFAYCVTETYVLINPQKKNDSMSKRCEEIGKYMQVSWNAVHISRTMKFQASELIKNWIEKLPEDDKMKMVDQTEIISDFSRKHLPGRLSILDNFKI